MILPLTTQCQRTGYLYRAHILDTNQGKVHPIKIENLVYKMFLIIDD
jgi:hypothetical protein